MSNGDIVSCLIFIYEGTEDSGSLEVFPGTHKGPIYSLWQNGVFTGSVSDDVLAIHKDEMIKCTGKAASVCLMHVSLLHGSGSSLSNGPRTLYITTYYAGGAIEQSSNHLPSIFMHELVRGDSSGKVRCIFFDMVLPKVLKDTSFFSANTGLIKEI